MNPLDIAIVKPTARGYTTNNMYADMPPLMQDGRSLMSSYQSTALTDAVQRGEMSNWEYRRALTDNAVQYMNRNFSDYAGDMGYVNRFGDLYASQRQEQKNKSFDMMLDKYYLSNYTAFKADPGVSYAPPEGDLKSNYMSREQLDAARVAPSIYMNRG